MNKIFKYIILIITTFLLLFSNINFSFAHAALPDELMDFVEANPDATQSEFDIFILENYWLEMLNSFYWQQVVSSWFQEYLAWISEWIVIKDKDTYAGWESTSVSVSLTPDEVRAIQEEDSKALENSNSDGISFDPTSSEFEIINSNTLNNESQAIISAKYNKKSFLENAKIFIIIWVEHILSWLDHILFVLSLVLILSTTRKTLLMLTVFTIAHSLTILLAWSEILTLSSKIVEPIIAFSIAYTAITTVFCKHIPFFANFKNKLLIIFIFALFHGLWFAWGFTEMNIPEDNFISSLLFFNLWIEIWQIIVLLIVTPFLIFLSRFKKANDVWIKIIALTISFLSIFWVIQRIFF